MIITLTFKLMVATKFLMKVDSSGNDKSLMIIDDHDDDELGSDNM